MVEFMSALAGAAELANSASEAAEVASEVGEASEAIGDIGNIGDVGNAASESMEAVGSVAGNIDNRFVQDGIIDRLPEGLQGMAEDMFDTLNDLGITDMVANIGETLNNAMSSLGDGTTIGNVADVAASRTPAETIPDVSVNSTELGV